MAKEKRSPLTWIMRALIVVIFIVAMAVAANRLTEWNQLQKEKEALEEQKEALTEE